VAAVAGVMLRGGSKGGMVGGGGIDGGAGGGGVGDGFGGGQEVVVDAKGPDGGEGSADGFAGAFEDALEGSDAIGAAAGVEAEGVSVTIEGGSRGPFLRQLDARLGLEPGWTRSERPEPWDGGGRVASR
jgi:hypothetical protein